MADRKLQTLDGVMYLVTPDGQRYKYADVLAYNNPGYEYDDLGNELPIAMAPPAADAPGAPAKPREYSFGDIRGKMGNETLSAAKAALFSDGTMTRNLLPEEVSQYIPPELGGVADLGLAGLLGLMGGIEKGAGFAAEVIDPAVRVPLEALGVDWPYAPGDSAQQLADDMMGMFEGSGFGPEGRIAASILSQAKPAVIRGVLDTVADLAADERGALTLPPSVRSLFDEGTMREGMIDVPNDPNALSFFVDKMKAAQDSHGPIGRSVDVYDPEGYVGMRVAMTPDADAGYAVKPDGEVASVVKMKGSPFRDFSGAVLRRSQPEGGYWLNAFDTALTEMYGRGGFQPVSRIPFSEEYARADWGDPAVDAFMSANAKYNGGRPDLVFMARNPSVGTPVVSGKGGLLVDDYDVATQLLEAELKRLGYR